MKADDTLNILIVDDENIVRRTLAAMIHHLGHGTEWAADGLAGQAAIQENHYNTAFVDIRMPGMDGLTLLKWSRKEHPELPVIIMSGHGVEDSCDEALGSGAFAFISKPFSLQEIRGLIIEIQKRLK